MNEKKYIAIVIGLRVEITKALPRRTKKRLTRSQKFLLSAAGRGAGCELDVSHMADLATCLEQIESIIRRARATVR
ncbi:MAG TPA: hypothetical protein VK797_22685 [Tepidisphaeraceae bacterium]|nr:hypothetical protein [Tepidisphaeraceae bacterium]